MTHFKDFKSDKTALGIMCFLITKVILTFVDILCVCAYFAVILYLLWLTFLKDYLEVLVYATVKCISRLKWVYTIFKIRNLLYLNTETDELKPNVSRNEHDSIIELSSSYSVKSSENKIPSRCDPNDTYDPMPSCSCDTKSTQDPSIFNSSQLSNSSQSGVKEKNKSSTFNDSVRACNSEFDESIPRKLSTLSTHIISSTNSFNVNEANFEDVDLSDEKSENNSESLSVKSNLKRSYLNWNYSKRRFLDSFRKNQNNAKTKMENVAEKITEAFQSTIDKEHLICNKNDSPEKMGCCTTLPHLFGTKCQKISVATYERF